MRTSKYDFSAATIGQQYRNGFAQLSNMFIESAQTLRRSTLLADLAEEIIFELQGYKPEDTIRVAYKYNPNHDNFAQGLRLIDDKNNGDVYQGFVEFASTFNYTEQETRLFKEGRIKRQPDNSSGFERTWAAYFGLR